jgi:hypothetical protein
MRKLRSALTFERAFTELARAPEVAPPAADDAAGCG